jgi:hypothetical protein
MRRRGAIRHVPCHHSGNADVAQERSAEPGITITDENARARDAPRMTVCACPANTRIDMFIDVLIDMFIDMFAQAPLARSRLR